MVIAGSKAYQKNQKSGTNVAVRRDRRVLVGFFQKTNTRRMDDTGRYMIGESLR
jgi:hypothetical protein